VDISVTAPSGYTVVCNGVLQETVAQENGWVRWVWSEPTAIPAYLVTIVVARLDIHEDKAGDLPVRYLVPEGTPAEALPRIFGRTPEMIAFFSERFGYPFPWPRYDQVVVEEFIFGGMENAGATTLTDLTLVDERVQPEWDPELLIAHELAHQWFGDLVTCRDWSQAWLNEGWATYSESLWIEHRDGAHMAAWYMWDTARGYLEEADRRYQRPIVSYLFREPIDLFDRHLYHKAGCVLHTLRHELGDSRFWPAVHHYLARHGHEAVMTRDFQRALEEATGRTLDGFFQQWIHSPGHPELKVKLSWAKEQLSVAVSQTQSGEGVPSAFHFTLRLGILNAETGEERVVDLLVKEREQTFVLPSASPRTVRVDPGFRVLARIKLEAPLEWRVALLEADACPVVRIRAAMSLGKSAEPAALEALCSALNRESAWPVRVELAKLLGSDRGDMARNALLGALDVESDVRVRTAIVRALGTLRHPDVDTALLQVALEGDPSLFAEGAAAECLGKLRSPLAVEACEAVLARDSWGDVLQARGLAGLGALRDPAWMDLLVAHASMGYSQRVRAAAIGALANLGEAVPACLDPVVEFLCESATDGPFRVVLSAVAGLGRLKDPKALGVLDRLHASAGDGRVRRMAWEAARDIREGRGTSDALQSLRDDFDAAGGRAVELRDRVVRLENRFES
jgi:aminopeptidase N